MTTRILIVDDSVVIRRMLSVTIDPEPDFEVLRPAPNGKIALSRIEEDEPDVVILDVEMPDMDGLETLARIRQIRPKLPVIMFSAMTELGASTTLEALSLGASDYLPKPSSIGAGGGSLEVVREALVDKVRALCTTTDATVRTTPAKPPVATTVADASAEPTGPVDAIVIGVSTGGPNALADLIPSFPADLAVPILIVQHMPPNFTNLLAERLDRESPLAVKEAEPGDRIEPGRVLIAPGDYHMVLETRANGLTTQLNQDPPENSCRPAADVLFRSAAEIYGERLLAVVLTGMGADGLRGCETIRQAGGQVIAQDEASSVVWGMPGAVTEAGLTHRVLPLDQISAEVCRRVAATHGKAVGGAGLR